MKINYSTSHHSQNFLYLDMPFRYAGRHYEMAFSDKNLDQSPSLLERVKHFTIALLESIPIINIIIAIADRYFGKSTSSKQVSPKSDLRPITVSDKPVEPTTNTSKLDEIQHQQQLNQRRQRKNPFFKANATQHCSTRYSNFEDVEKIFKTKHPLCKAILEKDNEKVRKIVQNPHFIGINKGIIPIEKEDSSIYNLYFTTTPLSYAIQTKNKELFEILIESPLINVDKKSESYEDTHPLEYAIKLGESSQYYIEKLIEKRCKLPSKKLMTLAKEKNVDTSLIDYVNLHDWDNEGYNALHRAIKKGDVNKVKNLVKKGICISEETRNRGGYSPLWIAVTHLVKKNEFSFDLEEFTEIVSLLVQNGADCNFQRKDTIFDFICFWENPARESLAIEMLEHGANPFFNGLFIPLAKRLRADHPIIEKIHELYPGQGKELAQQLNIASVWEEKLYIRNAITGQSVFYKGGNWSKNTYTLLVDCLEGFNEEALINSLRPLFSDIEEASQILQKSIKYANQLLNREDTSGWADEIREKSQEFPVILPAQAGGHASSIVIWKSMVIQSNRGANHSSWTPHRSEPGMRNYEWDITELTDKHLHYVIENPNIKSSKNDQTRGAFIDQFAKRVDSQAKKIKTLSLPRQKEGNCTWSSSALLGLHTALEAIRVDTADTFDVTEEGRTFIELFDHYAGMRSIEIHLKHLRKHLKDYKGIPNTDFLSTIACKVLAKIQINREENPFLDRCLDAIIMSGFPINFSKLYDKLNYKYDHDETSSMKEKAEDYVSNRYGTNDFDELSSIVGSAIKIGERELK